MQRVVVTAGALLVVLSLGSSQQGQYRDECIVWNNITSTLMYDNTVPMNCQVNSQCTGFDCTSEFSYNGILSMWHPIVEDFCYGIEIMPCSHPLKTHFYVAKPNDQEADVFQKTVTNTTVEQLPGIHYKAGLVEADGFVQLRMRERHIHSARYVQLGMTYETKMQTRLFHQTTWPDALSFSMMPETVVPVPDCDKRIHVPPSIRVSCKKFVPPSPSAAHPTFIPIGPIKPEKDSCTPGKEGCLIHQECIADKSDPTKGNCQCLVDYVWDGKGCHFVEERLAKNSTGRKCNRDNNSLKSECGEKMMCAPHQENIDMFVCQCIPQYTWSKNKCVPLGPAPTPAFIPVPPHVKDDKHSSESKIIIAGCVGAVVLIIAAAAVVVIIRYRQHQARYGGHSQLLTEEDTPYNDDAELVEA